MIRPMRSFRKLDKDLGRVSNAEYARRAALRPVLGPSGGLILLGLVALMALTASRAAPGSGLIAAGLAGAAALALLIGSNSLAGKVAPAVGAGAVGALGGLVLVGLMQMGGLMMAGGAISDRLGTGIIAMDPAADGTIVARVMASALLAAATWAALATWAGTTISPAHAIIGAIFGAGVTSLGWQAVQWHGLALVIGGWLASPIIAAVLAAALLALLRSLMQDREDPLRAARIWLPCLIAAIIGLFVLHVLTLAARPGAGLRAAAVIALICAALAGGIARRLIAGQIARHHKPRAALKAAFNLPLLISMLLMGFAHGANDAPTILAPLAMILRSAGPAGLFAGGGLALLVGLAIAVAAVIFGRRLVDMLGGRVTRLNASRAFCVSLATAITVLGAAAAGLPVSTIHVAVGGVFGTGLYRDALERRPRPEMPPEELARRHLLRLSHLRSTLGAWLISAPAAALLAAGAALILARP